MRLSDFMEELAYGELNDLSMAEGGSISPEKQPNVVIKINDVLNQLYIKYIIRLVATSLDTTIKSKSYTLMNPNSVRIVYVEPHVRNESDIYDNGDFFNLNGNTITFVRDTGPKANSFHLMYQFKPTRLILNPADKAYANQEIDMSPELIPLVRTMVASAIFTNMNGELHKKTGAELFNQAQFMQNDLELAGLLTTSVGFDSINFIKNGFV